jgi:hypothetical protein
MKWVLYLVVVVLALVAAVFCIGYLLPAKTTHTRSIVLKVKPEAVVAALADVQHMADWNRNTEKVEMLPSTNGKDTTRQTFKGGMKMIIITTESQPPTHLVRDLGDKSGPFAGSWTYEIAPNDGGSQVALTEIGIFKNPLFRVMARVFGQTKYIDEHLEDLARKFGETASVR